MRILISLENEENVDKLCKKLCNFLSAIEDSEIFVDIFHVRKPIDSKGPSHARDTFREIEENERKSKVRMIATLENTVEEYLQNKLQKSALVNSHLLEGDYKKKLEQHISFQRYDLLIINPCKKTNMELIMNGRNTHWIIDNLEIPVLVLPSYIDVEDDKIFDLICFIDTLSSYNNFDRAGIFDRFDKTHVRYIHFGKDQIHDNVECIYSSNANESFKQLAKDCGSNTVFVLHHKNKGDYLNFLNKSFTKSIIKSLENPLLIY